jgi:predicted DNA-binding transcriptional regulator AlpA
MPAKQKPVVPAKKPAAPPRHHLDKRAASIAAVPGDDDELLTTRQTATWLSVSTQWLDIGRSKGYGPPYEQLGPKTIRYRRGKVREWLDTRTRTSVADYRAQAMA